MRAARSSLIAPEACDFCDANPVDEMPMPPRRAPNHLMAVARRSLPGRALSAALVPIELALMASSGYLLVLLIAATRRPTRARKDAAAIAADEHLRLIALVPAHNEQGTIANAVDSLLRCDYPSSRRRIIVIADNCEDETALRALEARAEVWERTDPERRGKGFALAWAFARLTEEGDFDGVAVMDADCRASTNLLHAIDARLRDGAHALQVNYLAANPEASRAAALRFAGFALINTVRFAGKQSLGLSCGLVGTGMAFSAGLLRRHVWREVGLVEDGEYHMRLVLAGERSDFAHEAWVSSPMPNSLGSAGEERWEQGRLQLVRRWAPRLVLSGLARRDRVRLHAGLECLVPPQSLIAAAGLSAGATRLLIGQRHLALISATALGAQAAFVLGGLRLVRAPGVVYRALALAPLLIVKKSLLYLRLARGRGPDSWIRTERDGER
jgi:1,2-diacylglycerol 3-beta-glucosyltransferase